MKTFGEVSRSHRDIGPGFDAIRLFLSFSVVCVHSVAISYGTVVGDEMLHSAFAAPISAILPVFFALSGYLVMGSAMRAPSLKHFLLLRVLRIVPALATEITLSALFIGLIFSSLPMSSYLTDPKLVEYFGSLIGRISLYLPGVFAGNPLKDMVNGSLWTINPEIFCYVTLALCITTNLHRSKYTILAFTLALLAICLMLDYRRNTDLFNVFSYIHILIFAFCAGNALYAWRDQVPHSRTLFAACVIVGLVLMRQPYFVYLAVAALTYCVVYLGFVSIPRPQFLKTGDYSYGIYLYGFPVQQALSNLAPWSREWYLNVALSLPVIFAISVVSWHFIEKPALKLRKVLMASGGTHSGEASLATNALTIFALLTYAVLLSRWSGINSFDLSLVNIAKYAIVLSILTACGIAASRVQFFMMRRAVT